MNDNEHAGPENELFDIIESFAPGYQASLDVLAVTDIEFLLIKMSFASALTFSWSYVILHATKIDKPTAMAACVAVACAIGLWRLFKIEKKLEFANAPNANEVGRLLRAAWAKFKANRRR